MKFGNSLVTFQMCRESISELINEFNGTSVNTLISEHVSLSAAHFENINLERLCKARRALCERYSIAEHSADTNEKRPMVCGLLMGYERFGTAQALCFSSGA